MFLGASWKMYGGFIAWSKLTKKKPYIFMANSILSSKSCNFSRLKKIIEKYTEILFALSCSCLLIISIIDALIQFCVGLETISPKWQKYGNKLLK